MVYYDIVDGPTKKRLFKSFESAYSPIRTTVLFRLSDNQKVTCRILSLGYAEECGYRFAFRAEAGNNTLEGTYNSIKKTGIIRSTRAI